MAYPLASYTLNPLIQITGIQGIPIQLTNTMFVYTDGSILPSGQMPSTLVAGVGCTTVGTTVTATAPGACFQLVAGGAVIPITFKGSIQKPILLSQVKTILGVTTNDVEGLCVSPAINQMAQCKPTGIAPYSLGQFLNYCHNTIGGVTIEYNGDTSVPVLSPSYNLKTTVQTLDYLGANFYPSNGIKIDFWNNTTSSSLGTITDVTPYNYFVIESMTSTIKNGGFNNVSVNVYFQNGSSVWTLINTYPFQIFFEAQTQFTFSNPSYFGTNFYLYYSITNGTSSPTSFDIEFSILNGNTFASDMTTAVINSSATLNSSYDFSTLHTIDTTTDLYTIRVRKTGNSTWTNYITNVNYATLVSELGTAEL
jgi:hypothetical protein